MTWLLVTIFVLLDLIIVSGVMFGAVRFFLRPLAARFPAVQPLPEALTRKFQSVRIDMLNLGFAVHVTVDGERLHLTPVAILRWLGARTISIPWNEIQIAKRSKLTGAVSAKIGSTTLVGPSWCMELAMPADSNSQ